MALSELLNIVFGTGLAATVAGLLSIRSEMRRARGEAEKTLAEADTVNITNAEQATHILIENIVKPLKEELYETRKDLNATKREMARFRRAVEAIALCAYRSGCPVQRELQDGKDDSLRQFIQQPAVGGQHHRRKPGNSQPGTTGTATTDDAHPAAD